MKQTRQTRQIALTKALVLALKADRLAQIAARGMTDADIAEAQRQALILLERIP